MTSVGHVNKKIAKWHRHRSTNWSIARALQPILRERAHATEMDRRVSPEVTAMLADAQLLGIVKPKRFGGLEMGPTAMVRVGFELGRWSPLYVKLTD